MSVWGISSTGDIEEEKRLMDHSHHQELDHPIIVGVGQITHRRKIREDENLTAYDLARMAVDACIADTGRDDILRHLDSISLVHSFSVSDEHPVEVLCDRLGIKPAVREETTIGGNSPQWLVNRAADKIACGEIKMALLVGAEALYRDIQLSQIFDIDNLEPQLNRFRRDPSVVGDKRDDYIAHEKLHGMMVAMRTYPLFENALRARLGMSIEAHRAFLGTYFDDMAKIAADNPYAWFGKGKQIHDLATPSPKNPIFNFPYTKYMNPVLAVNQAAGVIVTGTRTARQLGIPEEKWVYLHGAADAHDKWFVTERVNYHSSPAIRMIVQSALKQAGRDLSDIDLFDLYSCFPCATVIAALEIGLPFSDLSLLSLTGGLSCFGGAGNNYSMHAIAHVVERLRVSREKFGLVTGIGWFLTKHTVGIYSGIEPKTPWHREPSDAIQARIEAMESPALCTNPNGPATIETYTVMHDTSDGIPVTIIIARLDSGERCMAVTAKGSDLAERMEQEDFIGYRGIVKAGNGGPNLFK